MRRSVSICVSPGPRMPMPPRWRSRWVHMRVSRGSRYWYWASSTCVRALAVRARLANMSRMSPVRSSTLIFSSFSMLATCFDDRSSSKIAIAMSLSSVYWRISSSLPDPTKVRESGPFIFCVNLRTVTAPAVSARNSSSSRYSLARASFWAGVIRPTSMARSGASVAVGRSFMRGCLFVRCKINK